MTRVNVVPAFELSDQHLIAEYRELPRCIKQDISISDAPETYCLGKGHMRWAKIHSAFLLDRYYHLCKEMKYRGFKISYSYGDLVEFWAVNYNAEANNFYFPTVEDINLCRSKLLEKIRMKPNWYKWTNRLIPDYVVTLRKEINNAI